MFRTFTTDLALLFTLLSVEMPRHHRDFLAIIVTKVAIYASFCLLHTAIHQTGVIITQARTNKNHLKGLKIYMVTKSAGHFFRKGDISSRPHDIMKIIKM